MRNFLLDVDEKMFNLLWRSITERESELIAEINSMADGSDEAALIGNDLVYLRLAKKELEDKAKSNGFSDSSFSLDDGFIDLSEL